MTGFGRRPPKRALLIAGIPYIAICFSVPLWDRIDPMILGLPFNMFWLLLWMALTPLCLWLLYRSGRGNLRKGQRR